MKNEYVVQPTSNFISKDRKSNLWHIHEYLYEFTYHNYRGFVVVKCKKRENKMLTQHTH